ncbi:hypothetical protein Esti_002920 [Eimeria stiedai]
MAPLVSRLLCFLLLLKNLEGVTPARFSSGTTRCSPLLRPSFSSISNRSCSSSSCSSSSCSSSKSCWCSSSSRSIGLPEMVARRLPAGVLGLRPLRGQPLARQQQQTQQQLLQRHQQQHKQQQRSRLCCWAATAACPLALPASGTGSPSSQPFLRPRVSRLPSSCLQQQQRSSSSSSGIYLGPFDLDGGVEGSIPGDPRSGAAPAAAAADRDLSLRSLCASVVKVYSDYTDPNYALPWQMQRQCSSTGSGFVVGGPAGALAELASERLLHAPTAAAAAAASCVRGWVCGLRSPTKYPARVLAIGHECDLALLTVDDEAFWENTEGLEFGEIPALQDGVIVLGYPRGGDNLCITSGVVSRVDVNTYAHSNTALLCVQLDAAINPGNSGGPALRGGRVVGVAFQGWDATAAQNVGYAVPANIIRHFLLDLKRHSRYTGFPAAGVVYQHLENKCMQQKVGLADLKPQDLPQGVTPSGIFVAATDTVRTQSFLERAKAAADRLQAAATRATAAQPTAAAAAAPTAAAGAAAEAARGSGLSEATHTGRDEDAPTADPTPAVLAAAAAVEAAAAAAAAAGKAPLSAAEKRALVHAELEKTLGLKPEDVILAVEGVDVAEDGTVHFRDMERVSVSHVIANKFMGETLRLTVLRDRRVQDVVVPLEAEHSLIPKHQWGRKARYLVYGGLVFCPLSLEYLKARWPIEMRDEFGPKFHERAPSSLLRPLTEVFASVEGEEPIVLTQILASDLTSGYCCRNCLLATVDGVKVRNMRHLAQLLGVKTPQQQRQQQQQQQQQQEQQQEQQQQSEFVTFVLEEKLQVVLNRKKAEAMLPTILEQHAIHSQTSEHL